MQSPTGFFRGLSFRIRSSRIQLWQHRDVWSRWQRIYLSAHMGGDLVLGLNVTRVCSVFYLQLCAYPLDRGWKLFVPKSVYQHDVLLLECNKIFRFKKKSQLSRGTLHKNDSASAQLGRKMIVWQTGAKDEILLLLTGGLNRCTTLILTCHARTKNTHNPKHLTFSLIESNHHRR